MLNSLGTQVEALTALAGTGETAAGTPGSAPAGPGSPQVRAMTANAVPYAQALSQRGREG